MPNRILREGILTSERIAKLSWPAEVFYRRLMSVVDDFGRFHAHPALLRAACYPLMLDKVSDADIGKWISGCEEAALVSVYPALDGKRYLEMLDFRQQVRAAKSKFPPPPVVQMHSTCAADAQQVIADAHLDGVGVGDVVEDSVEPPKGSPPLIELPLVDGTQMPVTSAMLVEWGKSYPAVDVMQQLREMRAWCLANPSRRKTARGIAGFVVRWLGKEQDRGGGGGSKSSLPSYT